MKDPSIIGLVLSILGTLIIITGELKGAGSIIRQRWNEVKGNCFIKLTCRAAWLFGTEDARDQNGAVVPAFVIKFWGLVFLCAGFVLQMVGAVKS